MKAIGNIYLSWRKGKGSRRIIVGVIKRNATSGIRFSYLSKGVVEAKQYGFVPYEGFPDINKEYSENVIEIFGQRIMRSERYDVDDFFNFWKIDKQFKEDNFYMLAYTQGLLPTDNFEFLADFNPKKGLSFISEIAGLSLKRIDANDLSVGDLLSYKKDSTNEFDRNAIEVLKGNLTLGYVKLVHSKVFTKSNKVLSVSVHHIEKNGYLNRVFLHISFE